MEIKSASIEEMEARLAEIRTAVDAEDADLDALEAEARDIKAEMEARKAAEAQRNEVRNAVAEGEGETEQTFEREERKTMTVEEIRKSHEYNVAYANYIKTGDDAECRALLSENATGGYVPVPEYVEGRIRTAWEKTELMELVRKTYIRGNLKVGFELSATGAYIHTESTTAVTEEALTLGIVEIVPASIKKWISISDEALDLGGEQFLDYVYDELTYRIAKKAQEELLAKIVALTASATSTAVSVPSVAGTPTLGIIASAIGQLSDEANDPVIVMNKGTWAQFKAAQAGAGYNYDPFEGRRVIFDSTLPAYTSAGTTGSAWAIVGDFGVGAQANFPNGAQIGIKKDELSLAEKDLVKFVGRQYVGLGIVADKAFAKIVF